MLMVFAGSPNRAFTREELLGHVWGEDYFGSDRAVDHLIKRIRKKWTACRWNRSGVTATV